MTANDIQAGIATTVTDFLATNNISATDNLVLAQSIDLTNAIAGYLDTVNPNDVKYPPTPR